MSALPSDIGKYTVDGVVIEVQDTSILTLQPDARDGATSELETFFDSAADLQAMLIKRSQILFQIAPHHEMVEITSPGPLGNSVPFYPTAPIIQAIDAAREIKAVTRLRAFTEDTDADQFAVEIYQMPLLT